MQQQTSPEQHHGPGELRKNSGQNAPNLRPGPRKRPKQAPKTGQGYILQQEPQKALKRQNTKPHGKRAGAASHQRPRSLKEKNEKRKPRKGPKKARHVLRPQTAPKRPLKYFNGTLYIEYKKKALKWQIQSQAGNPYRRTTQADHINPGKHHTGPGQILKNPEQHHRNDSRSRITAGADAAAATTPEPARKHHTKGPKPGNFTQNRWKLKILTIF